MASVRYEILDELRLGRVIMPGVINHIATDSLRSRNSLPDESVPNKYLSNILKLLYYYALDAVIREINATLTSYYFVSLTGFYSLIINIIVKKN